MARTGSTTAILAAVLFGVSTPMAKLLVHDLSPWMLAGLLYLGSGTGLALVRLVRGLAVPAERSERSIRGAEWFWLLGAVLAGGIAAPVLLMSGLAATPASSASLLLNLEGVFTALLAWFVFREGFDRRLVAGMIAIVAGAVALSWDGPVDIGSLWESPWTGGWAGGWGAAAIAAACLMWALDNNLTRKVSLADPMDIAMIKGLVAGCVNVGIALALGDGMPAVPTMIAAMLVGLLGYGVSLVLFVFALRHIGTARTGAYFSTAPFVGGIASLAMFGEPLTAGLVVASVLMGIGVWLHLTEDHDHDHAHEEIVHDHPHVHDEHHQHGHDGPVTEPHSHRHRHGYLRHRHPHYPDAHHVHTH
ncbi:DMT family transporter [Azospirillum ramasamyi]|uniref:EamA family transporter n=1 Tax=Azospirillum ramasamyi TaxID=682998 RepID=A0A2U9S7D3_9PROT|nr:DMT family transporter [Azospirillum ramasamyi]AWU94801.1 EamA family transporter [Azospirillum ramasamyi]